MEAKGRALRAGGRSPRWAPVLAAAVALVVACESDGGGVAGDGGAGGIADAAAGGEVTFVNLRAEEIAATRAVLRFETSVPATCAVRYGIAPDALDGFATDPSMTGAELSITHQVPVEDLAPATPYWWRGVATDAAGATWESDLQSFTTADAGAGGDALVDVATHEAGATVSAVSSNFGGGANDSTWGADHAIDGKMATEWATNGDGDEAWLEIDLGQRRTVTHVGLRSRAMPDGSSIVRSFTVSFDDGEPRGPFATPDPEERYRFDLGGPVDVRRVRFDAVDTTGGNTGVREIELLIPAP